MLWATSRCFLLIAIFLLISAPAGVARRLKTFDDSADNSPDSRHAIGKLHNSAFIFSGTVQAIQPVAADGNGVAIVQITFHVDQGLRGVRTGQYFTIHEWSGLWQSGERYRPGQRVMLFLFPFSKLGLTSPVGGAMGRFDVAQDGRIIVDRTRLGPLGFGRRWSPEQTRIDARELVRTLHRDEE